MKYLENRGFTVNGGFSILSEVEIETLLNHYADNGHDLDNADEVRRFIGECSDMRMGALLLEGMLNGSVKMDITEEKIVYKDQAEDIDEVIDSIPLEDIEFGKVH